MNFGALIADCKPNSPTMRLDDRYADLAGYLLGAESAPRPEASITSYASRTRLMITCSIRGAPAVTDGRSASA